jgi:hypothetical protein
MVYKCRYGTACLASGVRTALASSFRGTGKWRIAGMSGTADYSYRPPGNYGGKPSTQEELRYAFDNAPACHHDHGLIAREAAQFLAAQAVEGESDASASA